MCEPSVTDSQLAMLVAAHRYGGNGEGWAEVELQFLFERGGAVPAQLEASLCWRVFSALVKKGLAERHADGPVLTESGREVLRSYGLLPSRVAETEHAIGRVLLPSQQEQPATGGKEPG